MYGHERNQDLHREQNPTGRKRKQRYIKAPPPGGVDFLASTAGLQVDLHANLINGFAQQLQADYLSVAGVLFVKVGKKLNLQFFFRRCRAELVQNQILYGRL